MSILSGGHSGINTMGDTMLIADITSHDTDKLRSGFHMSEKDTKELAEWYARIAKSRKSETKDYRWALMRAIHAELMTR